MRSGLILLLIAGLWLSGVLDQSTDGVEDRGISRQKEASTPGSVDRRKRLHPNESTDGGASNELAAYFPVTRLAREA